MFLKAIQLAIEERFNLEALLVSNRYVLVWLKKSHGYVMVYEDCAIFSTNNESRFFYYNIADPAFDPEKILSLTEKAIRSSEKAIRSSE